MSPSQQRRRVLAAAVEDLAALGWSDAEIATAVGVTDRTVRSIRGRLAEKRERIERMAAAREELGGRPTIGDRS